MAPIPTDHAAGAGTPIRRIAHLDAGPQCAATPDAIRPPLDAGHPAERLFYYRGGIHTG